MTNEEAIRDLKKLKSFHNGSYGSAVAMAIDALEKQVPKAPIDNEKECLYECPNCGRVVITYWHGTPRVCHWCYQVLSWEEVEG